jgi:hypothetical protein
VAAVDTWNREKMCALKSDTEGGRAVSLRGFLTYMRRRFAFAPPLLSPNAT